DTTLYGHTKLYQTPNIERLAKRGMTFTRAYSASPLCSPTRSSILTGLHPARTGLTTPNCHTGQPILSASEGKTGNPAKKAVQPNPVNRLDTKFYTLGESFRDAGYATGHFGKWHLGAAPHSPLEHGFEIDIPHWHGPGPAGNFVAPWRYPDFDPNTPNEHIEDRMAEEAVAFMEKNQDKPFLLNYWMFSVHAPFDAKPKVIDKYRALIDPKDPQRSPTYAAMVEAMDDAVGTLIDALDRLKIADNTIIVFFSDNGGNMYNEIDGTSPTSNFPLRGGKAAMFEGGVRVPMIVAWPGNIAADTRNDALVQSTDFFPTFLDLLPLKKRRGPGVRWCQHCLSAQRRALFPRSDLHLLPARPTRPRLDSAFHLRPPRALETRPRILPRRGWRAPLSPFQSQGRHRREKQHRHRTSRTGRETRPPHHQVPERHQNGSTRHQPQFRSREIQARRRGPKPRP
ncbi:sulfatase, partial [bacterium]|nr:sulfatase [bacterium]